MFLKQFIKKRFSSYLIKNGTILNADRYFKGDVLLNGGKIIKVSENNPITSPDNCTVIDAKDKYIIPGGIDPHTHMELPFMGEVAIDDFHKGSRAAVSGGTTTFIDFILPDEQNFLLGGYENWRKKADGKVNCDYALHSIITKWNPEVKRQMAELTKLGVQSFKIFLGYKDVFMMNETEFYQIAERTKEVGGILMVHCENGSLIHEAQQKLLKLGITGPEGHYMSRPESFEALATHQAITIAEYVNCPLYIVHLMCKDSSEEVQRAIERGSPVFGETLVAGLAADGRNQWHPDWNIAGPHIMSPPIRPDPIHKKHLMSQLHVGNIHTTASDNCTFCLSQKMLGKDDFTKIPNGVNGIEDRLAVLWTKGVHQGKISKTEFVKVTSTNAAKIFNLYPRKGIIQEGADADVVIWNGTKERVISKDTHHQAVDFNVFEGMIVNGTAEQTFSAGKLVYSNSNGFSNLNQGRYIPREMYGFPYERIPELDRINNPLNYKVDRTSATSNNHMIFPEDEEFIQTKLKLSELMKENRYLKEKLSNQKKI